MVKGTSIQWYSGARHNDIHTAMGLWEKSTFDFVEINPLNRLKRPWDVSTWGNFNSF